MSKIKKYTGTFTFRGKNISFRFCASLDENIPPDTVLFLGAGTIDPIPNMVARRTGPGVVVAQGVPHWGAGNDASVIPEFSMQYFTSAYQTILDTFDISSLHVLAESQAGPAPVAITLRFPGHVGNCAFIRPLGFTTNAYGSTVTERLTTLRRRIALTYMQLHQTIFYDLRNAIVGWTLLRAMAKEPSIKLLQAKYAAGVSYDLMPEFIAAIEILSNRGRSVSLLLGENDKIFRPEEIINNLKNHRIDSVTTVIMPKESHSSLACRASQPIIDTALRHVRET